MPALKPTPIMTRVNAALPENGPLYRLDYIKDNTQRFALVQFKDEWLDFDEIIKSAKHYCAVNNYRFVYIKPAIIVIDKAEGEET